MTWWEWLGIGALGGMALLGLILFAFFVKMGLDMWHNS